MSLSVMRPQTAGRQQKQTTAVTVPPTITIYTVLEHHLPRDPRNH